MSSLLYNHYSIYLTIIASRCDLETDTACSELPSAPPLPVNQSWTWCWCLVSLKSYEDDHFVNHLDLSEKENFSEPSLEIRYFLDLFNLHFFYLGSVKRNFFLIGECINIATGSVCSLIGGMIGCCLISFLLARLFLDITNHKITLNIWPHRQ